MSQVTLDRFHLKPLEDSYVSHPVGQLYSISQMNSIQKGFLPLEMDDRWVIYFEENILYLHRSWNGHCIFKIHFRSHPEGFEAYQFDVLQNSNIYQPQSSFNEVNTLSKIITTLLL